MNSMSRTDKKKRSRQGETLTETLIAVLIAALAMAGLVTFITTSTRLIHQTKVKMAEYYSANNLVAEKAAEAKVEDSHNSGRFTAQDITDGIARDVNLYWLPADSGWTYYPYWDVEYYENDTAGVPVIAYQKRTQP